MSQPAILGPVPAHARFLFLNLKGEARTALSELIPADDLVIGLGPALLSKLGVSVDGVRPMPDIVATTPTDLCIRIQGSDPGVVLHRERALRSQLRSFEQIDAVSGFMHADSRDLSGYIDGTENPTGDDATRVAQQDDGSSVLAIQRWEHNFAALDAMSKTQKDHAIGRERVSNDELEDAPESAHVKRTAQEDFDPEAFTVRRSMPWRDQRGAGLVFVSFSATLDPFEAQLRRMLGEDDGIVDALFQFTKPVTGAVYWCPAVRDGALVI